MKKALIPIFDEGTHTYKHPVSGLVLPSVTQILDGAGLIDTRWYNPMALLRGKHFAEAAHLYDMGVLDQTTVREVVKPFFDAYLSFLENEPVQMQDSERARYSEVYQLAGTEDKDVLFWKRPAILELKTGTMPFWARYQAAGYELMAYEEDGVLRERYGVLLKKNGSYKVYPFREKTDRQRFLHCVSIYQLKLYHGLKEHVSAEELEARIAA